MIGFFVGDGGWEELDNGRNGWLGVDEVRWNKRRKVGGGKGCWKVNGARDVLWSCFDFCVLWCFCPEHWTAWTKPVLHINGLLLVSIWQSQLLWSTLHLCIGKKCMLQGPELYRKIQDKKSNQNVINICIRPKSDYCLPCADFKLPRKLFPLFVERKGNINAL